MLYACMYLYIRAADNYWILKRIIGRMSVDYPVGDSLQCMLRHCQGKGYYSTRAYKNNSLCA